MSVFPASLGPNTTCQFCKHRHPPSLTCAAAEVYGWSPAQGALADVSTREGTKFVPLPDGAGKLNCATVFNGMLLIGCEGGVWARSSEGTWRKIEV